MLSKEQAWCDACCSCVAVEAIQTVASMLPQAEISRCPTPLMHSLHCGERRLSVTLTRPCRRSITAGKTSATAVSALRLEVRATLQHRTLRSCSCRLQRLVIRQGAPWTSLLWGHSPTLQRPCAQHLMCCAVLLEMCTSQVATLTRRMATTSIAAEALMLPNVTSFWMLWQLRRCCKLGCVCTWWTQPPQIICPCHDVFQLA
mmetsp:Transcript_77281/g.201169  ORF Transcript_77281/g.201169 Transcript_77281/m.201169 type:complete len:202 (-) Transcript_77281:393-998(-)